MTEWHADRVLYRYIFDTGVQPNHDELKGRVQQFGASYYDQSPYCDSPMYDTNGHGTHVAGIVGSTDHGVAPWVTLWNVKVLPVAGKAGGTDADLARAVNDVVTAHNAKKANSNGVWRGSVINMSLGAPGRGRLLPAAILKAYDAGIPVIAAAGNENRLATNFWPCNAAEVICVGSVDNNYQKSSFSNWGGGVTIIAPGSDIVSTSRWSNNVLDKMSGTSQASPHVAGMAAIWVYWEAISNDALLVKQRMWQNDLTGLLIGWDSSTTNTFATTGMGHPNKKYWQPYVNAPNRPARGGSVAALNEAFAFGGVKFSNSSSSGGPTAGPTATGGHYTSWAVGKSPFIPVLPG